MADDNEIQCLKVFTYRDDIDVPKSYKNALDIVIKDDKVKNIAFTGSYGSGKSSILRSYFKNTKSHWCVKIRWILTCLGIDINKNAHFVSLASFNSDNKSLPEIEEALLQQLFYSLDANKSKYSHIKRICHPIIVLPLFKIILVSLTGFGAYLYFTTYDEINKFIPNLSSLLIIIKGQIGKTYNIVLSHLVVSTSVIIAFMISAMIAYRYSKRFNLKKLAIVAVSAEANKHDSNPLNTYLDELIYFFRRHKGYNIFVFEDMDRLNKPNIFVKLREINKAVNDYFLFNTTYCQPRVIKFIYVLKDDVFNEREERTKLFDAIISVVPFISYGRSSYEKMKDVFNIEKNNNIDHKLKLLKIMSIHINDYRLILAIYNDYSIYKDMLNVDSKDLSEEKLLAMMIYKNCYPSDFEQLHYNKGLLYKLLDNTGNRGTLIKPILDSIYQEITSEEDFLLYSLGKLIKFLSVYFPKQQWYIIDGKIIQNLTLKDIEAIYKKDIVKVNYHSGEGLDVSIPHDLKEEFNQKYNTIVQEEFMAFKDYKGLYPEESLKILELLLANEYIDKDSYHLYIHRFYEGDLTDKDRKFLHALMCNQAKNSDKLYEMQVDNPKTICEDWLETPYFYKGLTNNITIMNYLLELKDLDNIDKLNYFNDFVFIQYYLISTNAKYSNDLIQYILTRKTDHLHGLETQNQQVFYARIFYDEEEYELDFKSGYASNLANFINKKGFELITTDFKESKYDMLKNLNIKIYSLLDWKRYGISDSLYKFIYENDLYAITWDNIYSLMEYENPPDNERALIYTDNYVLLSSHQEWNLYRYLMNNKKDYIKALITDSNNSFNSLEDVMINYNLESNFDYTKLFKENRIKATWKNITILIERYLTFKKIDIKHAYFDHSREFNKFFIEYLERNFKELIEDNNDLKYLFLGLNFQWELRNGINNETSTIISFQKRDWNKDVIKEVYGLIRVGDLEKKQPNSAQQIKSFLPQFSLDLHEELLNLVLSKLFTDELQYFNKSVIEKILSTQEEPYSFLLNFEDKLVFDKTEINEQLIRILKDKKIIGNYKTVKNKINVYKSL